MHITDLHLIWVRALFTKRLKLMIWFQLFETSAHKDSECDNIEAIFLTLAHKLKSQKPLMSPSCNSAKRQQYITLKRENTINSNNQEESCFC